MALFLWGSGERWKEAWRGWEGAPGGCILYDGHLPDWNGEGEMRRLDTRQRQGRWPDICTVASVRWHMVYGNGLLKGIIGEYNPRGT